MCGKADCVRGKVNSIEGFTVDFIVKADHPPRLVVIGYLNNPDSDVTDKIAKVARKCGVTAKRISQNNPPQVLAVDTEKEPGGKAANQLRVDYPFNRHRHTIFYQPRKPVDSGKRKFEFYL